MYTQVVVISVLQVPTVLQYFSMMIASVHLLMSAGLSCILENTKTNMKTHTPMHTLSHSQPHPHSQPENTDIETHTQTDTQAHTET